MARLDGLGSDLEEKMVGLAGEVSSLDLRITNNLTALGECGGGLEGNPVYRYLIFQENSRVRTGIIS